MPNPGRRIPILAGSHCVPDCGMCMDSMAEEEKKKRRQAGQSEAATGCEPRHACPTELGLKPGGAVLTKLCKFLHLRRMQWNVLAVMHVSVCTVCRAIRRVSLYGSYIMYFELWRVQSTEYRPCMTMSGHGGKRLLDNRPSNRE